MFTVGIVSTLRGIPSTRGHSWLHWESGLHWESDLNTPTLPFTLPRHHAFPTEQISLSCTRTTVLDYAVLRSSTRTFQHPSTVRRDIKSGTVCRDIKSGTVHRDVSSAWSVVTLEDAQESKQQNAEQDLSEGMSEGVLRDIREAPRTQNAFRYDY